MKRILFAFGSVPKDGGTFTFYRNLRPVLLEYGIDMRCVAVGKSQAELWEDAYADDGCVLLAPRERNIKAQAMAFAKWCEQEDVDVAMGVNSEAILSALPHLPERIRVLSRCANGFDHGYKITLSGRERLAGIVALSPRLAQYLIEQYGADPALVHLIPNGIDPAPFDSAASTPRGRTPQLQLGFLGRLEHNQKGVFHLPEIVRGLSAMEVPFKLRIAGKGKHRQILERKMLHEVEIGQVEFLGALVPDEVPQFLAETDVFIFTSHIEGLPNALLEAMMAGCVPVSWLIEGITDFIIEDGMTGFICKTGNYPCFVSQIEALSTNRECLRRMSEQVAHIARERFTNRIAAATYAALIKDVMEGPPIPYISRSWDRFTGDPNFEHHWTNWLRDVPMVEWLNRKLQNQMNFRSFSE